MHLCLLANGDAYLVGVDAPEAGAAVVSDAVEQVVPVSDPPLLLLVSGHDIVAVDGSMVIWRSPRLAHDHLRVVAVDSSGISCTVDRLDGSTTTVVVDPRTGGQAKGPRFNRPLPDPVPRHAGPVKAFLQRRDFARQLAALGACGACGHPWNEHAGSGNDQDGMCGECAYEFEHDQRQTSLPGWRLPCPPIG